MEMTGIYHVDCLKNLDSFENMAYRRIRGIPFLVYEPDQNPQERKHQCKDCFFCQWCSDDRCSSCLKNKKCKKKKSPKKRKK